MVEKDTVRCKVRVPVYEQRADKCRRHVRTWTLQHNVAVHTHRYVHVTKVVRLVEGPHTADLLMKAQLPKIAQLPLVIQYHTWHTRVR